MERFPPDTFLPIELVPPLPHIAGEAVPEPDERQDYQGHYDNPGPETDLDVGPWYQAKDEE